MKPKKASKLSLGPGGLKGFFFEHVEKMVLAAVLVVVVCFVYFGSKVETFPQTKTPDTMMQIVNNAGINIEKKSWEKVKETILPPSIDNPIVINVREEDWKWRALDERIQPSRTKRRDPDIYPPVQLEVEAMVAGVGMVPGEEEIAPIDLRYNEMIERQQAPVEVPESTKKKKKKGRDEEDLLGAAAEGMGAAGALQQVRVLSDEEREELTLHAARVSSTAIARSRNIVALKALIPYQKQLLEYQDALAGNPQFVNDERDTPTYVFFKVERADVTDNPNADPKTLKWQLLSTVSARNLPFVPKAEWDVIPDELVDPTAVLPATDRFGALTLPVPPAVLTDLRKLAGHAEIAWANVYGGEGPAAVAADDGKKKAEGPDMVEGPEDPDSALSPMNEGPGGYRPGMRGEGSSRYRGGYDESSGSTDPKNVVYKLFRFIDFDVQRGRQYRYRVNVMLEDPNHPQLPTNTTGTASVGREGAGGGIGNDPPPASLDKTVEERLRELKKEEEKTGKRKWYRETDWSEASSVVSINDPMQFVGGSVSPPREQPIAGTMARVAASEAVAKTIVVKWDDEYATNVVTQEDVQRGSTLNFTKDAEALHPVKLEYVELKDYRTRTDAVVVDIRGGERLPGSTNKDPMTSPGQVAVIDHTGKLVVLDEAKDLKSWHRYGKVEPIKIEEPKVEESSESERDLIESPRRTRRSRE